MKKAISLLGSTGSIGKNALEVIRHLGPDYSVVALAAHSQVDLIEQQADLYKPELVALYDEKAAAELKRRRPHLKVVAGLEGICEAASQCSATMVLSALSGTIGLKPTLAAIQAKKDVALANKEALVAGGELVMSAVRKQGVKLLPVDSEHSALFQCLVGEEPDSISRLVLTASGGPFYTYTDEMLSSITSQQALNHPTWKMGPKVSCDSSTLMNKGLEMIEAHFLFNIPASQIEVVIHPQSLIHSMVEFKDGSIKAQLSEPDMKLPIQYAFTYPTRQAGLLKPFDFIKASKLEFFYADHMKFRCLALAYQALFEGGSMPCYMNAANEILVSRFLQGSLGWSDIAKKLEMLMNKHKRVEIKTLDTVLQVDRLARIEAKEI